MPFSSNPSSFLENNLSSRAASFAFLLLSDLVLAPHLPRALLPEGEEGGHACQDPVHLPVPVLHRGRLPGKYIQL